MTSCTCKIHNAFTFCRIEEVLKELDDSFVLVRVYKDQFEDKFEDFFSKS